MVQTYFSSLEVKNAQENSGQALDWAKDRGATTAVYN
jgi:hypothetical protein